MAPIREEPKMMDPVMAQVIPVKFGACEISSPKTVSQIPVNRQQVVKKPMSFFIP